MDYGVIFDCDGTLVDSLGQALESFNFALDQMGEPPRTPNEIKKYFGAAADRIFMSLLGDEQKAARAFELYLEHQSELALTTSLHEGIRDLLDQLEAEQIPIAIVTGRHSRDLELVLKPHRLADRFMTLVSDDQLPRSKPAPDGILIAAQKMGLPPSRAFYVGDSVVDVQAARAAGSVAVAATWDALARADELRAHHPHFVAPVPSDVGIFLKQYFV